MPHNDIDEQIKRLQTLKARRRAASLGGKASAATLTPEQLHARAMLGVAARHRNAIARDLARKPDRPPDPPATTSDQSTTAQHPELPITCPTCILIGYSPQCASCQGTGQAA